MRREEGREKGEKMGDRREEGKEKRKGEGGEKWEKGKEADNKRHGVVGGGM